MGMDWDRPAGRMPAARLATAPDDRRLGTLLLGVGAAVVVLLGVTTPSPVGLRPLLVGALPVTALDLLAAALVSLLPPVRARRRRGPSTVAALLPAAVLAADPLLLAASGSRAARPATELLILAAFALGSSRRPGAVLGAFPVLAAVWWVAQRPALAVGVPRLLAAGLVWTAVGELVATGRARAARHLTAVRTLAETDPLTAVGNRRALQRALDVLPVGGVVTVLDIDHFKTFNDRYGHVAGDVVLRDFARVLAGAVRNGDSVSRYGGEEFVLVVNDPADAADLFLRIRTAWEAETPPVTFSAGLAARRLVEAAADTLARADAALYEAKAAGRNRFAGAVPERTLTQLA